MKARSLFPRKFDSGLQEVLSSPLAVVRDSKRRGRDVGGAKRSEGGGEVSWSSQCARREPGEAPGCTLPPVTPTTTRQEIAMVSGSNDVVPWRQ